MTRKKCYCCLKFKCILLGFNLLFAFLQVHFFRPVPKEYLHSAELRDIMQFGSSNTAVFFKMRVAGVLHIFQFETKQVQHHYLWIIIIMKQFLRRYSIWASEPFFYCL